MLYSKRFKISAEDAEEIVNDSILKALDSFDSERGSFEGFCKFILRNKLLNFKRDNIDLFILIVINEYEDIITANEKTMEEKENNIMAVNFINELKKILSEDEIQLFNALYESCDLNDKISISKVAKSISLSPQNGWDIFRKIQRKAKRINDLRKKQYKIADENLSLNFEHIEFYCRELSYEGFEKKITTAGFGKLINSLNIGHIQKLNSIYSFK